VTHAHSLKLRQPDISIVKGVIRDFAFDLDGHELRTANQILPWSVKRRLFFISVIVSSNSVRVL
jgi:hypothetical protein